MVAPLHTNLAAALAQLDGGARQFDVVAACERSLAIDQDFVKARVRRAGALSALERHAEAISEMEEAVRANRRAQPDSS